MASAGPAPSTSPYATGRKMLHQANPAHVVIPPSVSRNTGGTAIPCYYRIHAPRRPQSPEVAYCRIALTIASSQCCRKVTDMKIMGLLGRKRSPCSWMPLNAMVSPSAVPRKAPRSTRQRRPGRGDTVLDLPCHVHLPRPLFNCAVMLLVEFSMPRRRGGDSWEELASPGRS